MPSRQQRMPDEIRRAQSKLFCNRHVGIPSRTHPVEKISLRNLNCIESRAITNSKIKCQKKQFKL